MDIYAYSDYRKFLGDWIDSQPKGGRGLLKKWSEAMNLHATLLSQILHGKKELNLEQGEKLARLLSLTDAESEYFLLLILEARAGTHALRQRWKKQIEEERRKANSLHRRLEVKHELSDSDRGLFYSSWIYSGIRNLVATGEYADSTQLALRIGLPREIVQGALEFLIERQLCVEENGKLRIGSRRTHMKSGSPFALKHHQNWRLQGFEKMQQRRDDDLFFTFPMSLSRADAEKIRALIPAWLAEVNKIVEPSDSEVVRCLNVDFFEY